jgi:hypothetical protein
MYSSRITGWDGGTSFGQRYFLPSVPLLTMGLFFFLDKSNGITKKVFFIILLISIIINLFGTQNWEWIVGEEHSVLMREDIIYKASNSFAVIANPIADYYIPMFVKYGFISRLLEGTLDIRASYIYNKFSISGFLALLTLLFLF